MFDTCFPGVDKKVETVSHLTISGGVDILSIAQVVLFAPYCLK